MVKKILFSLILILSLFCNVNFANFERVISVDNSLHIQLDRDVIIYEENISPGDSTDYSIVLENNSDEDIAVKLIFIEPDQEYILLDRMLFTFKKNNKLIYSGRYYDYSMETEDILHVRKNSSSTVQLNLSLDKDADNTYQGTYFNIVLKFLVYEKEYPSEEPDDPDRPINAVDPDNTIGNSINDANTGSISSTNAIAAGNTNNILPTTGYYSQLTIILYSLIFFTTLAIIIYIFLMKNEDDEKKENTDEPS